MNTQKERRETKMVVKMHGKTIWIAVLLVTLLMATACQPLAAPMDETPTQHAALYTATMEGFAGPDELPAGWTDVALENQSDDMRNLLLMRLADGNTIADVEAALAAGVETIPEWLVSVGGPAAVLPGTAGAATVNLSPGTYLMVDPVPGADGVPGMAKGYVRPLFVTASEVATAPPAADVAVELTDYAFILPEAELTAGERTIEFTNSGVEPHEMIVVELAPDATVQDFMAAMAPDAPAGPPPGLPVAGMQAIASGEVAYTTIVLESGKSYAVICFIPATAEEHMGMPHAMLGMVSQFSVN